MSMDKAAEPFPNSFHSGEVAERSAERLDVQSTDTSQLVDRLNPGGTPMVRFPFSKKVLSISVEPSSTIEALRSGDSADAETLSVPSDNSQTGSDVVHKTLPFVKVVVPHRSRMTNSALKVYLADAPSCDVEDVQTHLGVQSVDTYQQLGDRFRDCHG
jgi:hypothetical protein